MIEAVTEETGKLFGDLWHRYGDRLFDESVELFARRFEANGFDLSWFQGKRCLDVGCGGGRYTLAMAALGAGEAVGCDVSPAGLQDARRRAAGVTGVRFDDASVLDLPYPDNTFEFVCCSGVLHHTTDPKRGLSELARVLQPGGKVYLLLYGRNGLRWPTMMHLRPIAKRLGYRAVDKAIQWAGLPPNKQRTFLDDLFVPLIRFYAWDEVKELMTDGGFVQLERWERGKMDHESSVPVQRAELEQLWSVFATAAERATDIGLASRSVADKASAHVQAALDTLDAAAADFSLGRIDQRERDWRIFGWGHHRVLAAKAE